MQTEERVNCPSCGGDNPKAAAFCWRCYASFSSMSSAPARGTGTAGTRPAGRVGVPPMPGPPTTPPPTTSGGSSTIVRLGVGALVAFVVAFGVRSVLSGGPSLPDTLAGMPRMTSQDAKDFEEEMSDYGKRFDLGVAAGAYGTGVMPTFFVLLIDGRSDEGTDDIFNQFVGGMTSGGASAETSAITSGERDGLEYRCVPVAAAQIQAATGTHRYSSPSRSPLVIALVSALAPPDVIPPTNSLKMSSVSSSERASISRTKNVGRPRPVRAGRNTQVEALPVFGHLPLEVLPHPARSSAACRRASPGAKAHRPAPTGRRTQRRAPPTHRRRGARSQTRPTQPGVRSAAVPASAGRRRDPPGACRCRPYRRAWAPTRSTRSSRSSASRRLPPSGCPHRTRDRSHVLPSASFVSAT